MNREVRRLMRVRTGFLLALGVAALLLFIASSVRLDHQLSRTPTATTRCMEDQFCYQPLINGNHRGTVTVLPGTR
jgi:hypothetical protein